jgi:excisionase family DNA binding protein
MAQLSVNEVARLKNVSVRTVYRAVSESRLSAERVGRAVLIPAEAVEAWTPMVTKARPQVRADEALRSTLETIIGFRPLAGSRHLGVVFAGPAGYRAYLERLIRTADEQSAGLTVVTASLSVEDASNLAEKALKKESAPNIRFVAATDFFGDMEDFKPASQAHAARDLIEQGLAGGSGQAWYSVEVPDAAAYLGTGEAHNAWAGFEAGVTRLMRHLPGIAISVLTQPDQVATVAAFAACYPQCVLGDGPGYALHATALSPA